MKCTNCGAEGASQYCQYCGCKMPNEAFKRGCPKCGSTNLQFNREKQGEVLENNSRRIIYKTVGLCRDCGFTWFNAQNTDAANRNGQTSEPRRKRRTWLWVLGWIFVFPVPLTLIVARSKMRKVFKILILVPAWLIYSVFVLISLIPSSDGSGGKSAAYTSTSVVAETAAFGEQTGGYSPDGYIPQFYKT